MKIKNVRLMMLAGLSSALVLLSACTEQHGVAGDGQSFAGSAACGSNPYLKKYGCSLDRIETAAQQGDPDAQYALGYMYFYGIGTVRDTQAAKLWIRRAADQGQPLAVQASHILHYQENPTMGATQMTSTEAPSSKTVEELNSRQPTDNINKHLPRYSNGSRRSVQPVVDSLKDKPSSNLTMPNQHLAAAHTSAQPKPVYDPRLARGANVETPYAKTVAAMQQASAAPDAHTATNNNAQPASAAAQDDHPYSSDEMALMNDKGYTVQLMASVEKNKVMEFVAEHNLQNLVKVYNAERNGKTWYVAVYGEYQTAAEARQGIANLPPNLRNMKPWVKSVRLIQTEIRLRKII